MLKINHVAIIVSCEEALDFYKKIGFIEQSRLYKPEKKHTMIFMKNENGVVLELFIKDAPSHANNPENLGLRHLAFDVTNIDELIKILKDYEVQKIVKKDDKTIAFIYDYDKQVIEFIEEGGLVI